MSQLTFKLKKSTNQHSLMTFFVDSQTKIAAFEKLYSHINFKFRIDESLTTLRVDNESADLNHSIFLIENNSA